MEASKKLAICLCILICSQAILGQSSTGADTFRPGGAGAPTLREIQERDMENRRREMENLTRMRPERRSEKSKKLTKEEKDKIEALTTPGAEYFIKHEKFLKTSNTGLFRLLPNFDCENRKIVRVDGKCTNFVPGAWSYSFRTEAYSVDGLQDISYKGGALVGDGQLTQSLLVALGDKPLESVSLADEAVKYLADFIPETSFENFRNQSKQIIKGIERGGYRYAKSVAVKENTTYAMRVVAYRIEKFNDPSLESGKRIIGVESDKRKDLIVSFRILEKSSDGGLTILWKELKSDKAPKIVYSKNINER